MNRLNTINLVAVALVAMVFCGCASAPKLAIDPMPMSLRYSDTVSFEENLQAPLTSTVRNADNVEEVVKFALSLSARGRHQHAAEFFADAAQRFRSTNNELEVSLYAAAANEYLKAGDMTRFRDTIRQLRQTASKYQSAAFDRNIAALVSLGDIASGGTEPNELTPPALKELYRIKTQVEGSR